MAKRKNRVIYETQHRKQKIEQHEPNIKTELTYVLRKGERLLIHLCRPSLYSCYKPGVKSWMGIGWDSASFFLVNKKNERGNFDYDKGNISAVICDTDILKWLKKNVMVATKKLSKDWLLLNH